jgi:hypothetical protein
MVLLRGGLWLQETNVLHQIIINMYVNFLFNSEVGWEVADTKSDNGQSQIFI